MAVHILTFVGLSELVEQRMPTSREIAISVNTNPVVVRRINLMLKEAGLISVRSGVGGVHLLREPAKITLREIFSAVKPAETPSIFNLHHNTNQNCRIGSTINAALSGPLSFAQESLEGKLEDFSLYDMMQDVAKKNKVNLSKY